MRLNFLISLVSLLIFLFCIIDMLGFSELPSHCCSKLHYVVLALCLLEVEKAVQKEVSARMVESKVS
jgi:hypothetical protein